MSSERPKRRPGSIRLLAAAFLFYSRIPMPRSTPHDPDTLTRAAGLLPVVGLVVGAIAAGVGFAASMVLPDAFATVLAMGVGILATGAFHEDGLSDTADGLGGGWSVEQKLEIMKDSRSGAYGVITTVIQQLAVFSLLLALDLPGRWVFLILAHIASRVGPMIVMAAADYLRVDKPSKVGGAVGRQPLARVIMTIVLSVGFSAGSTILGLPTIYIWLPTAVVVVAALIGTAVLRTQIGGYTGDTLGAIQQVCFTLCIAAFTV